jgi:hypothetical protein
MKNWIWPQKKVAEPNALQRFARLLHWTTTAAAVAIVVAGVGGWIYWLALPAEEKPVRETALKEQYVVHPDTKETGIVPLDQVEKAKERGFVPASAQQIELFEREDARVRKERQLDDTFKKFGIVLGVLTLAAVTFFAGRGLRYLVAGE